MTRFKAMAEAQRELIGTKQYSSPYHWGGYVVIGRP
jgi:CHAT domain-containing protein